MPWWDSKDSNSLLGWGVAGMRTRPERSTATQRSRRGRILAEIFEGVSQDHDQRCFGLGPFGRASLRRGDGEPWKDYWKRHR